jgi:hypothetical protein
VIDDGSTDRSREIVQYFTDPRIRFFANEQNLGVASTRNRGLDLARGQYVAFIDCDDVSVRDRLGKQVEFMDNHPGIGICGSWMQEIYADGQYISGHLHQFPAGDQEIREMMMWTCPIWNPTVMIRLEIVRMFKVRHDAKFVSASDFDFMVKMAKVSQMANLPETLHYYRRHQCQITTRRTFEANRNASLVRSGLIADEVRKFLPGVSFQPLEGLQLSQLSAADFFAKLLEADQVLEELSLSGDPEMQSGYLRLRRYLDIIWFDSLANLPRYEMQVLSQLQESSFYHRLPAGSQLALRAKSLLRLKPEWIRQVRTVVEGKKAAA